MPITIRKTNAILSEGLFRYLCKQPLTNPHTRHQGRHNDQTPADYLCDQQPANPIHSHGDNLDEQEIQDDRRAVLRRCKGAGHQECDHRRAADRGGAGDKTADKPHGTHDPAVDLAGISPAPHHHEREEDNQDRYSLAN
jgi:hypothetical protein